MMPQAVTFSLTLVIAIVAAQGDDRITPIPMEQFDPRITEFRRIDRNGDERLTFTEFLLGHRAYIEAQSKNFYRHDLNGDGIVTRNEFDTFYKRRDDEQRQWQQQADNFLRNLRFAHNNGNAFEHLPGFGRFASPPQSHFLPLATQTTPLNKSGGENNKKAIEKQTLSNAVSNNVHPKNSMETFFQ